MFGEKLLVSSLSFPNCVSGSISKINLKSSSPRNRKQRAREWIMEDMTFSFWLKERSIYFSSLEDTNWLILPFLCKRQSFSSSEKVARGKLMERRGEKYYFTVPDWTPNGSKEELKLPRFFPQKLKETYLAFYLSTTLKIMGNWDVM